MKFAPVRTLASLEEEALEYLPFLPCKIYAVEEFSGVYEGALVCWSWLPSKCNYLLGSFGKCLSTLRCRDKGENNPFVYVECKGSPILVFTSLLTPSVVVEAFVCERK
ncbi:hypothetical protein PVK06_023608 [Gossypium arboreum]|uniref:Uncharacterized protein n=1 Tax=Gossypium arboreum TaxID=29729 RepID=A0ABR0PBX1_GOSAR|nr:hypothetical protein PVK06_023608 [Gossypium arboreum]